ncbi:hypothetical protein BD324DRAFT_371107 [Kockovaella imperatae]|uniref:Uncharacterized protein n=1 Tax=Kockovaella imperatae TaxID=4999 RepID=A0A1Y1UKQ5_9TREE|nr:hypothetical protein BD324DRAFT_371107 [Kockovaella imperatae]ORX38630.1 hypothetical protein BD324DRAFT_371107 [Kockovaella imperatae]
MSPLPSLQPTVPTIPSLLSSSSSSSDTAIISSSDSVHHRPVRLDPAPLPSFIPFKRSSGTGASSSQSIIHPRSSSLSEWSNLHCPSLDFGHAPPAHTRLLPSEALNRPPIYRPLPPPLPPYVPDPSPFPALPSGDGPIIPLSPTRFNSQTFTYHQPQPRHWQNVFPPPSPSALIAHGGLFQGPIHSPFPFFTWVRDDLPTAEIPMSKKQASTPGTGAPSVPSIPSPSEAPVPANKRRRTRGSGRLATSCDVCSRRKEKVRLSTIWYRGTAHPAELSARHSVISYSLVHVAKSVRCQMNARTVGWSRFRQPRRRG